MPDRKQGYLTLSPDFAQGSKKPANRSALGGCRQYKRDEKNQKTSPVFSLRHARLPACRTERVTPVALKFQVKKALAYAGWTWIAIKNRATLKRGKPAQQSARRSPDCAAVEPDRVFQPGRHVSI
jgi:hypothetical protein